MVFLSGELDTAMLKPLIGIAVVKLLEKTLQQAVASRIDALQVVDILKRVGAIAASAARYLYLGQYAFRTFQDGDVHLGAHLLEVDGQEETCGTTANDSGLHSS